MLARRIAVPVALLTLGMGPIGVATANPPSVLSGYGGPGAGKQVILKQQVFLPGGGGGGASGGPGTGTGTGPGSGSGTSGSAAGRPPASAGAGASAAAGQSASGGSGPASVVPGGPGGSGTAASATAAGAPGRFAQPVSAVRAPADGFAISDPLVPALFVAGFAGLGVGLLLLLGRRLRGDDARGGSKLSQNPG